MKPRIDPNKWYCPDSLSCIRRAKAYHKICLIAKGSCSRQIFIGCKKWKHKGQFLVQGFWLVMKDNVQKVLDKETKV